MWPRYGSSWRPRTVTVDDTPAEPSQLPVDSDCPSSGLEGSLVELNPRVSLGSKMSLFRSGLAQV
jgi:hypothetical protein